MQVHNTSVLHFSRKYLRATLRYVLIGVFDMVCIFKATFSGGTIICFA